MSGEGGHENNAHHSVHGGEDKIPPLPTFVTTSAHSSQTLSSASLFYLWHFFGLYPKTEFSDVMSESEN
jgi:hypothetical protein